MRIKILLSLCSQSNLAEVQIRIGTEGGIISILKQAGPEGSSCIKKYISAIQTIVPHGKKLSDQQRSHLRQIMVRVKESWERRTRHF